MQKLSFLLFSFVFTVVVMLIFSGSFKPLSSGNYNNEPSERFHKRKRRIGKVS